MDTQRRIEGYQETVDKITELQDDASPIQDAVDAIDELIDKMVAMDFPDVDLNHFREARTSVLFGVLAMKEWLNEEEGSSAFELERLWGLSDNSLDY